MALDYGRKRIGLALSDPLGISAQPLGFFEMSPKIFLKLEELIIEKQVIEIVVGYPKNLKGEVGTMAKEVDHFVNNFKKHTDIPIVLWDERLTTAQAEAMLIDADVRRNKRKQIRDSIAASLILQSYLAYKTRAI
ncbi:MAG: Holliday junction resolvase RuvX [Bdellovibrionales bacterium]|nr:Holliday junction resolvase RuvX [Bdellovibrionales bacterium]